MNEHLGGSMACGQSGEGWSHLMGRGAAAGYVLPGAAQRLAAGFRWAPAEGAFHEEGDALLLTEIPAGSPPYIVEARRDSTEFRARVRALVRARAGYQEALSAFLADVPADIREEVRGLLA